MDRMIAFGLALGLAAGLAACGQDMTSQEKLMPDKSTELFPDGKVDQHPPAGTVDRSWDRRMAALTTRPPMTLALVERGRQRYQIACAPCHGLRGDGDGIIPHHGFPRPPDYEKPGIVKAPDAELVDVITHGHGVMYSYADRVSPADRWAVVAYVRALQLARATPAALLTPRMKARLSQAEGKGQP